jgi:hypothetical protein
MNPLLQLEIILYSYFPKAQVPFIIDAKKAFPGQMNLSRNRYLNNGDFNEQENKDYGLAIFTNAVSENSILSAQKNLCQEIEKMWPNVLDAVDVDPDQPKKALDNINQYRNAGNGFGNVSFGYFFKQAPEKYKIINIIPGDTRETPGIAFDINSIYSGVNIQLLLHPDNRHTTALLLGLGNINGQVSPDSVKYATNPKPKPKSMTKQAHTLPHMDIYSDELNRIQAIINADSGNTKLFHVPGSNDPRVKELICKIIGKNSNCFGFVSIITENKELEGVLTRYAIAAPYGALTAWKSGVIHFEGIIDEHCLNYLGGNSSYYTCKKIGANFNQQRLRFIVGTHYSTLSTRMIAKSALLAKCGLLPAVYPCTQNIGTEIDKNIVCKKTTQYKFLRKVSDYERAIMDSAEEKIWGDLGENIKRIIPNKLERHLMGITQDLDKLGFSKNDLKCLEGI